MRWAQRASVLDPKSLAIANTLGVAQYRAGAFADALATLRHADSRNAKRKVYARSNDLAFIAMALHRLGKTQEARAALAQLQSRMKNTKDADDAGARACAAEAERLLAEPRR